MKFKTYNQKTAPTGRKSIASIKVSEAGAIRFSEKLIQIMDENRAENHKGQPMHVEFLQSDENLYDWYFRLTDSASGFKIRANTEKKIINSIMRTWPGRSLM
jgi:hypothetical protein